MIVTQLRRGLTIVLALTLIIALLATISPLPRAAAQQRSYALDIVMIGKGQLTESSSIKVCKDRIYTIHAVTRRLDRFESLVPNTQISVLGATRGSITPSSAMTSADRPYDPAVFRYKANDEGTETLRF